LRSTVAIHSLRLDDPIWHQQLPGQKTTSNVWFPNPEPTICNRRQTLTMSSTNSSTTSNEPAKHRQIKVAIIGAGLSGLAVANGLLKDPANRFDVQVYERDTIAFDSERGGYQVRISSNGLGALRSIADQELWSSLQEVWEGDDAKAPALVDPSTFNIQLHLADLKLYPKSHPVSRQLLRHALLRPLLVAQRVHLSHKFENFTFEPDGGVRLHFTDRKESASADILIAADGSGSAVNRQVGLNNKIKLKEWVLIQSRGPIDKVTRDQLPRSLLESGSLLTLGGKNMSGYASVYAHGKDVRDDEYTLFWSAVVPSARGERLLAEAENDPKKVVPLFAEYLERELGYGKDLPFIMRSATELPRTGLVHSGLNLNIQIQKLVFRFNSIQIPIIQYSGFIQDVIPWQVLAEVNVSEVTGISTICSP
jgi:2-polyprenyl-6-methoxyphenol hydroxylase-like FAD-dependent oxidoreductase